jgi:putative ABC transport system permease protein
MSALDRKSWKDLRRRPARTTFTIATIAFAVAGLWIFAMPVLMDDAMNRRIAEDRLHDVQLPTSDVVLEPSQLAALRAVPGVSALDTRTIYDTRIVAGAQRRDVLLVGVPDWGDQRVNAISVDEGDAPHGDQVVTDSMNDRSGRYGGAVGDRVEVADTRGHTRTLTVAGRGDTLLFSQQVVDDQAVLYAPQRTVNALADVSGTNSIELRVTDPERAEAVAAAVRARLLALQPDVTFPDLADVRDAGSWPGEEEFNNFSALLYVGAVLALVSALVLISNTMTTIVAEQSREVAIMKAIGGRRRQIRRSFFRTAFVLGVAGTVFGIALGIPFANVVLGFVGNRFLGITPEWGAPVNAFVVSVVVGIGVTVVAAVPALRRAARTPVHTGLEGALSAGGDSRLDRALRHLRMPRSAQIGLRNVTRRRTRSLTTILQISLAVSVALGFLALGVTVGKVTADTWDTMRWDVIVSQRSTKALDANAARMIEETPGVATGHPLLYNTLEVDGGQYESWGMPPDSTLYEPDIVAGRWLRPGDEHARRSVVVIGRALANTTGTEVGDTLRVGTARGGAPLQVIGIDAGLGNNGTTLYLPLTSFQRLLGRTDTNAYWVVSQDQDEAAIDRVATAAEERLTAAGYPVATEIHYVEKAANLDSNRVLIAVLAAMGIPIVFIGMIGLLNSMTMNVIERTRDVGVLRCIGASSRVVRRIFRSEALTVALAGALVAVPGGWLVGKLLVWVVTELFDFGSIPYTFPLVSAFVAVVATLALAWLVVIAPLRRAAHMRPGDALRYE